MNEYLVVFERAEDGGWGAYLPICRASWRSELPARRSLRIQEAVDAYSREASALGQRLPSPVAATGTIEAA